MSRRTLDLLVSISGLFLAAFLLAAGGLLTWAHGFVAEEVHSQLAAQKIYFPPAGSAAVAGPQYRQMRQYGGQQLTSGAQAKVYADHYIANHLSEMGGGRTYAELSTAAREHPDDAALAGTVDTVFKGETLRGLLLNAYAFDTMGTIAGIAAVAAFVAGAATLLLAGLGWRHARRVPTEQRVFLPHANDKDPVDA